MSGLLVVGCLNEVNMLRSVVATVIVILYFCTLLSANGEEEDILQESKIPGDEEVAPMEDDDDDDGVLVLNHENFDAFIRDTETALVEFYAPWCGHCRQLAPEYAEASKELMDSPHPVLLGKVDATIESQLAERFSVSGYPTLIFFKNGINYPYDGPRNKEGIVKFMSDRADPNWKAPPDAVVVLTIDNFTSITEREELMLVEFYAPWCGHCKNLAPKYERAAKVLKEAPVPMLLAKVDATLEKDLANKYNVTGFPSLFVFRNGRHYSYKGGREEGDIIDYMNRQRGAPAKPVGKASLRNFLPDDDIAVLAFFDNEDDPRLDLYQEELQDIRDEYALGFTTDSELTSKFKANAGSVYVLSAARYYTKHEPKWYMVELKEGSSPASLSAFIAEHHLPLVGAYDGKLNERYAKTEKALCIVFYYVEWNFDHREATQLWRYRIADIAKDYKQIVFAVADDDSNEDLLKNFGLADTGVDMNIGILDSGKKYVMGDMDEFDGDHVRQFLDSFGRGELSPHINSQPIPKKQLGPVKVVVGSSFQEIVYDRTKDVLIEMYAPWCGHCKKLEPVYRELAMKFKNVKDLVIAKLDATANDTPDEYKANGFPTIYFAPSDSKSSPIKYSGERDIDSFVSFLKEKATVPLIPAKVEL